MASWNDLPAELQILIIEYFVDNLLKPPVSQGRTIRLDLDCEPYHAAIRHIVVVVPEIRSKLIAVLDERLSEDTPGSNEADPAVRTAYGICPGNKCVFQRRLEKRHEKHSGTAFVLDMSLLVPKLTTPSHPVPIPSKRYVPKELSPSDKMKIDQDRDHFTLPPLPD